MFIKISSVLRTKLFLPVAALLCLSVLVEPAVAQQTPASKNGPSTSAKEKKESPSWSITPNPNLPNVLILGDSISIGYTRKVRQLLADKANVFRPHSDDGKKAENCQGTSLGIRRIDDWLEGQKWDVIHFNWGLHDLKRVKEAGSSKNSTSPDDPYQATVPQYSKNLNLLVGKLKATGAKLIFATTTPVVPESKGPLREAGGPRRYNAAALEIMKANDIMVNDLFALCKDNLHKIQLPKNVHFKSKGKLLQARSVAAKIAKLLPQMAEENVEKDSTQDSQR